MIPEIGKEYYFFDDGKMSPSRCYRAKVLRVIPYPECDEKVDYFDSVLGSLILKDLKEIHQEAIENHRQDGGTIVLSSKTIKPGDPWLYSEDTDYFIECEIPGYDDNPIWFVRSVQGGWFSMNIQSSWQSGSLDTDSTIYEKAKNYFDDSYWPGWYDHELSTKGELICRE